MNDNTNDVELLKEDLRKTKLELYAWKDHAHNADEMLAFLDKQGPKNPAAEFYSPVVKRIIKKVENDYLSLKKQLTEKSGLENAEEILKEKERLRIEVARLREVLQTKFKENQRLQKEIVDTEYKNILAKCTSLQNENGILKSNLMLQNQTNTYMKECVDNLKDEFLEIFLHNVKLNGDEFIKAVKELDSSNQSSLPKSLLTPLKKSQGTDTSEMITVVEEQDLRETFARNFHVIEGASRLDSAVGTQDEELQETNALLREFRQENDHLKNELESLKMEKEEIINQVIRESDTLRNELAASRLTVEMREQEANDFKNEGDRVKKEIFKLKQEFSQLRDYCRKLEGERKDFFQRIQSQFNPPSSPPTASSPSVPEPFQENQPWNIDLFSGHRQSGILVRDGATTTRRDNAPSYPTTGPSYPSNAPSYPSNAPSYPSNAPSYPSTGFHRSQSIPPHVDRTSPPTSSLPRRHPPPIGAIERMNKCEHCNREFPTWILFDHMKVCDKGKM